MFWFACFQHHPYKDVKEDMIKKKSGAWVKRKTNGRFPRCLIVHERFFFHSVAVFPDIRTNNQRQEKASFFRTFLNFIKSALWSKKKLFSWQKNVPLGRHGEVRGAVIIQSADENSFTLPPRHLSLANQRSSIVEERADLIGVASAWGVVLSAQGYCISLAWRHATGSESTEIPLLRDF